MKRENINGCAPLTDQSKFDYDHFPQELSEMLSNNLTLDEEDLVQAELRELQASIVRLFLLCSSVVLRDPLGS